ncbi:NAD(P)/FAD-dependent oxidoreductase [Sphingosinicella humi]|uniref:FAD-dependent oxidoreductase n=1 Tax=Allosphingosinicella humi TaxID=2068657 RepID=A0A2U2IZU5_9SPHN|nr:FAD-binding oxidoreductase [Sphingosinicella humi]PWG01610.1 FAD-dependent oxidoreductase [Sphingosinicella humi]
MRTADILVIGGGVAGLSAAARLARHGRVVVLEAEDAHGYHSSGRSVSFSHFGIGDAVVRGLTAYSQPFFENPPEGFCPTPLCRVMPSLYVAGEETMPALEALYAEMARFTDTVEWTDEAGLKAICPILKTGSGAAVRGVVDRSGLKLDADALLQSFGRAARGAGAELVTGRRIAAIRREGESWIVRTEAGEQWSAPILVNAAGAWADRVAGLAGVEPLGLQPKRRTIIVVDPPAGMDVRDWPFLHSIVSDFYMMPEAGQLLVSPADEVPDEPGDAQPEDYDIALAADRLEHYTTLSVTRIAHRWAGLRSFVADRVPTAGFAPDAPGFFWLAGQGGYGLQTAPAMAEIVETLVTGGPWPQGLAELGVTPDKILPDRLFTQPKHSTSVRTA